MSEIDEFLKKMDSQPGVLGSIIMTTKTGITIKTTLKDTLAAQYSSMVAEFLRLSKSAVSEFTPKEKTQCIRIRSFKNEILIFPDSTFTLIVLQDSAAAA